MFVLTLLAMRETEILLHFPYIIHRTRNTLVSTLVLFYLSPSSILLSLHCSGPSIIVGVVIVWTAEILLHFPYITFLRTQITLLLYSCTTNTLIIILSNLLLIVSSLHYTWSSYYLGLHSCPSSILLDSLHC